MQLRCRALGWTLFLFGLTLGLSPARATGQGLATLGVEENFRREPNGVVLARLSPGTQLRVISQDGNWSEVVVEAWVWLRSLQVSEDPGYDLVVSVTDGENIRSGPAGRILGRLQEGTLLTEVDRDPAWARVSRGGWIWTGSLQAEDDGTTVDSAMAPVADVPSARSPGGFAHLGEAGGPILAAPDGDTLGMTWPDSDVEVVGREGNWARVRLEGWMWMPPGQVGSDSPDEPVAALEPSDMMTDPEMYAGRVVEWTLQFISIERAEAVRTDFFEGEPFLLTRFGGGDGPFVYVAVPPERLVDVEGLVPLERIAVTGRIRTGASSLTGTPIIDLVVIDRSREAP